MRSSIERLYSEACRLTNILYYKRHADPRYTRIYVKAMGRQERRGVALTEWRNAEAEELIWIEAQSDYYGR